MHPLLSTHHDWGIPMTIRAVFAWYDFWIGIFWDRQKRRLYILPLPCCGVVVQL